MWPAETTFFRPFSATLARSCAAARQKRSYHISGRIVEQAARGPEPWLARRVLSVPARELSPDRRERYLGLVKSLVKHQDRTVSQAAWNSLEGWLTVDREGLASLAADGVADLENPDWERALNVWVQACRDGGLDEAVQVAVAKLLERGTAPDAQPDRDRPARQRLGTLVQTLAYLQSPYRGTLGQVMIALAPELPDPEWRFKILLAGGVPALQMARAVSGYEDMRSLENAVSMGPNCEELTPEEILDGPRRLPKALSRRVDD